jgi:hypothetical protein
MQAPMNRVALPWLMPGANRPGHGEQERRDQAAAIRNGAAIPGERHAGIALFALDLK